MLTAAGCVRALRQHGVFKGRESYFSQLVSKGIIPFHTKNGSPKKWYYLEEVKEALKGWEDPSRDSQRIANEKRRKEKTESSNLPLSSFTEEEHTEFGKQFISSSDPTSDKTGISMNKVRIFKEMYQGKNTQLDYQMRKGDVIEKSVVVKEAFERGRLIRDNLQNIPFKFSLQLANVSDPKKVEKMLEDEIERILAEAGI